MRLFLKLARKGSNEPKLVPTCRGGDEAPNTAPRQDARNRARLYTTRIWL